MTEDGLLPLPTDYLTLVLLIVALMIFVWLVVRSHNIRSFQFQVSIFIAIMVAGGIVELLSNNGIIRLPSDLQELGFLIHVGSMVFFSLMIWLRYYISKRNGKKMIEEIEE
jgi:hypothetical protein